MKRQVLQIDERVDEQRLAQFASELAKASPVVLNTVGERFRHQEPADFYEGLLAGFVASYVIMTKLDVISGIQVLGINLAFTADLVQQNRKTQPPKANEDNKN